MGLTAGLLLGVTVGLLVHNGGGGHRRMLTNDRSTTS
jgi:hypothetical protein